MISECTMSYTVHIHVHVVHALDVLLLFVSPQSARPGKLRVFPG